MKKVAYIIGDIHGCLLEPLALEKKIADHAAEHGWSAFYVGVGDLLDRGPSSAEVVEHWRQRVAGKEGAVVMGNHESMFLRQIYATQVEFASSLTQELPAFFYSFEDDFKRRGGSEFYASLQEFQQLSRDLWLRQGGSETLLSYGLKPDEPKKWQIDEKHWHFLSNLPLLWEDEQVIVSHALLDSRDYEELKKQGYVQFKSQAEAESASQKTSPTVSNAVKDAAYAAMWKRTNPRQRLDQDRLHISGHTPMDDIRYEKKLGFVQLDTACVYGRRLTAYCPQDESFLTVDSHTTWLR